MILEAVGRVRTMCIAGHALSMPSASAKDKTLSLAEVAPYFPGLKSGVSRRENEITYEYPEFIGNNHNPMSLKEWACITNRVISTLLP
jgi:hypothetical protein